MALVATSASTDFEVKVPALVGVMLPKSNSGGAARARTGFISTSNLVVESAALEEMIGAKSEKIMKPKRRKGWKDEESIFSFRITDKMIFNLI